MDARSESAIKKFKLGLVILLALILGYVMGLVFRSPNNTSSWTNNNNMVADSETVVVTIVSGGIK